MSNHTPDRKTGNVWLDDLKNPPFSLVERLLLVAVFATSALIAIGLLAAGGIGLYNLF